MEVFPLGLHYAVTGDLSTMRLFRWALTEKLKIRETGRRCSGPCPAERRPGARPAMAPGNSGSPTLTGASSGPGGQHRINAAPLRSQEAPSEPKRTTLAHRLSN